MPAAFLNYIVLDEQMNIVPGQSGAIQIGGVASAWNAIGTSSNIRIEQPGYVLAFLNSFALSPVSFDHLNFTYYRGNEIEENHYYPFGLCLQTASLDPALKNNIKYNSKELQHDEFYDASGNLFGLQWEDYGARMQDPQIGRWNGIDAKAEKYSSVSPYNQCINNPIKYFDIDGKDIHVWGQDAQKFVDAVQSHTCLKTEFNFKTNHLTFSGIPETSWDKTLMRASIDTKINVNMQTTNGEYFIDDDHNAKNGADIIIVGGYGGSVVDKNGIIQTLQYFNIEQSEKIEKFGTSSKGIDAVHEIMESYNGGKNFPGDKGGSGSVGQKSSHKEALLDDSSCPEIKGWRNIYGTRIGIWDAEKNNHLDMMPNDTYKLIEAKRTFLINQP